MFYSPAGDVCEQCPLHSKPSTDSTHCRCDEGYFYDHWTQGLTKNQACKKCGEIEEEIHCRTLKIGTSAIDEVIIVEGKGGKAEKEEKGTWIHISDMGSMSSLHCMPGNCISCDDAVGVADLLDRSIAAKDFLQLLKYLGRGGELVQNRANATSNSSGPAADATCKGESAACLAWQKQAVGTQSIRPRP
jgi:hypothetical protein